MKEGSQSFLKHRVPAGQYIVNDNNARYSLSFRRFLGNKTTPDGQADAANSSVTHSDRNTHRPRAVVFAGTRILEGLTLNVFIRIKLRLLIFLEEDLK